MQNIMLIVVYAIIDGYFLRSWMRICVYDYMYYLYMYTNLYTVYTTYFLWIGNNL